MKLARTLLTIAGLTAIFSTQVAALKITEFKWHEEQGQVKIDRLAFKGGMFGSQSCSKIDIPKNGMIDVVGIEEGNSTSISWGIYSFDMLIRKIGKSTNLAVVQIAVLSENDKKSLMTNMDQNNSFYNKVLSALKQASFVTFAGSVFDVSKDFDKFIELFQQKIKE